MNNIKHSFTFEDHDKNYPCEKCDDTPCCRYIAIPHKVPVQWMDLDYIRYLLNFPDIRILISKNGKWEIVFENKCRHLDEQTKECEVHGTSEQPKTCSYLNPYRCFYKVNLNDNKDPLTVYILDRKRFEHWSKSIKFDENGMIIDGPSFEKSLEILKEIDIDQ